MPTTASTSSTQLRADLHVHTIASGHGFATVTENAEAALAAGLELIALTDHGPAVPQGAHPWYFWNLYQAPSLYKGLRILKGCEANIVPDGELYESNWGIDMPDVVAERLDFVQIGFHPSTGFDAGDRDANTDALLHAFKNPLVDQLNHPGNLKQFPFDVETVIAAAVKYNIILEFNNSSLNPLGSRQYGAQDEIDFAAAAYEAGAVISLGSDSHYFTNIGVFEPALTQGVAAGIPQDYYLNLSAERVLSHLTTKRSRTHLDAGPSVL